jgi:hypothetical protein
VDEGSGSGVDAESVVVWYYLATMRHNGSVLRMSVCYSNTRSNTMVVQRSTFMTVAIQSIKHMFANIHNIMYIETNLRFLKSGFPPPQRRRAGPVPVLKGDLHPKRMSNFRFEH